MPETGLIQASGAHLILNGAVYHFTGVNAYEAATQWGVNEGCGGELSDAQLNQLFSSLPPNSLVRIWAFQGSMATNVSTRQLDWGPLDRVFAAATAHGQRLIVVLTDQDGTCDGGYWQNAAWYSGGFKTTIGDATTGSAAGLDPIPYWAYLQDIVRRYADSPALGMWEPVSEAEASSCPAQFQGSNCYGHLTCPDESAAAGALRYFFDTVGAEIHLLDPTHLVESGLGGGGQCGTQGTDYRYVSASPGIDVLSYHDYYGAVSMGGDQWNGESVRMNQAMLLGKPIIGGELGLLAGDGPGCMSYAARDALMTTKESAQMGAGSSGVLAWDWVTDPSTACNYDIGPSDPLMAPGGAIG